MRLRRKALLLTATVVAAATALGTWTADAAPPPTQAATDIQPTIVEDYAYPGAETIQATYNVTLISGDGHIMFADCATPPEGNIGLLTVTTTAAQGTDGEGRICFKILATPGRLQLKIPAVYEIRGDGQIDGTGHTVQADLTTDAGQHTTVNVNPSRSTPVGVATKPGSPPTTLLQLTATA
jgi:hypothetical protein